MQTLCYAPPLAKVGCWWSAKKVLLYYDTNFLVPVIVWLSTAARRLPMAKSQTQMNYCNILKNLAFPVEPPRSPIRPTLRDGH